MPLLRRAPLLLALAVTLAPSAPLRAEEAPKAAAPSAPTAAAVPPNFESFIVVLLVRPADAPDYPKAKLDEIQAAHLANIRRLAEAGQILHAGPFEDHSGRNVRGMFILKTDSVDRAREWVSTDPAVQAGRLKPEFMKWFVEKGRLK